MRGLIESLKIALKKEYTISACCCGHNKYPMTIITRFQNKYIDKTFDLVSGEVLKRRRNFYKRDKQGYYYIPETVLPTKHNIRLNKCKALL